MSDMNKREDSSDPSELSTVLAVDDEPEFVALYESWLGEEYRVLTATSGEEALQKLDGDVDVVLLDRRMPGISGADVLVTVRNRDVDCRVCLVTAVEPDLDLVDLGFDEYVVKPTSRDAIHEVVTRLLHLSTYDERTREYFSLVRRRETLAASLNEATLRDSPEYAELESRLESVREELHSVVDGFDVDDFEDAYQDVDEAGRRSDGCHG